MKHGCPNQNCIYHKKRNSIIKDGTFTRRDDSRIIQRYRCKFCSTRFSSATFSLAKGQMKRRVNRMVYELMCSKMSINRIARVLRINPKTVVRKQKYLAKKCEIKNSKFRNKLKENRVLHMQFDDLITTEHTKMKPLSVSIAIDANNRSIIGFRVSRIPANGLLADKSRRKYGKRKSEHFKELNELFKEIKGCVDPLALIRSDEHMFYRPVVKRYFPLAAHEQTKGGRGCIAGQGELKKLNYDPLFMLNHTFAMMRDGIGRLIRKTWGVTKDPDALRKHLEVFMCYHNENLKLTPLQGSSS